MCPVPCGRTRSSSPENRNCSAILAASSFMPYSLCHIGHTVDCDRRRLLGYAQQGKHCPLALELTTAQVVKQTLQQETKDWGRGRKRRSARPPATSSVHRDIGAGSRGCTETQMNIAIDHHPGAALFARSDHLRYHCSCLRLDSVWRQPAQPIRAPMHPVSFHPCGMNAPGREEGVLCHLT